MTSRAALLAGLFASVMATASCGESPNQVPAAPVGPSTLSSLLLPRLDGVWGGDLTLSGVAGGTGPARNAGLMACVGATFEAVIGENLENRLLITQTDEKISAKMVSVGTGIACTYEGQVGSGSSMVLHAASCQPSTLSILCIEDPVTGLVQESSMNLVGSSLTATFDAPTNVTRIQGTAAHTYTVPGQGTFVANQTFTNFTRR